MTGPMDISPEEASAANEVATLIQQLTASKVTIKLGHLTDQHRQSLTKGQVEVMNRRRLDILRVLLSGEMVNEARGIRARWISGEDRTTVAERRYGDLLFAARVLLPPAYTWNDETCTTDGLATWPTHLRQAGSPVIDEHEEELEEAS